MKIMYIARIVGTLSSGDLEEDSVGIGEIACLKATSLDDLKQEVCKHYGLKNFPKIKDNGVFIDTASGTKRIGFTKRHLSGSHNGKPQYQTDWITFTKETVEEVEL